MVQDLFLLSLDERGEGVEKAALRAILDRDAIPKGEVDVWAYPDGSSGRVHGLESVARPRAMHLLFKQLNGVTMLERVFEIADVVEVVVFWPGLSSDAANAFVTRVERLAKIGAALRSVLNVVVVRDADHLRDLIAHVSPLA